METGSLQSLIGQIAAEQVKMAAFMPGQILNGKILKLFPGQTAEVQIGSQKLIAQLEAPLSADQRYWFQVQPGEGRVHLKVMAGAEDGGKSAGLAKILSGLSMPATKENIELAAFFVKEKLPASKETLEIVSNLLKQANPKSTGFEAVRTILARGLPLTPETFSAIHTMIKEPSLSGLMAKLQSQLSIEPETDTNLKIKTLLAEMLPSPPAGPEEHSSASPGRQEQLSAERIKGFLASLGLSYEKRLLTDATGKAPGERLNVPEDLKPQLLKLITEHPSPSVKEAAEQVVHKITGFQLLSQESGPIQQLVLQMPIMLGEKTSEITMQWSGKKTADGKIDSAFCRILFYLELEQLKETVIDVQIQNKVMSIQVINEQPSIKVLSAQFVPELKRKLSDIGFHLSAVNFKEPGHRAAKAEKLAGLYGKQDYSGVDIKI